MDLFIEKINRECECGYEWEETDFYFKDNKLVTEYRCGYHHGFPAHLCNRCKWNISNFSLSNHIDELKRKIDELQGKIDELQDLQK